MIPGSSKYYPDISKIRASSAAWGFGKEKQRGNSKELV